MLPDHLARPARLAVDFNDVSFDFRLEDGSPDWNRICAVVGIVTEQDFRDFLMMVFQNDLEITIAVVRALASAALGRHVDPRHLPVFQPMPLSESSWSQADRLCDTACPGSDQMEGTEYDYQACLCRCDDRIERWKNCLRYRERLLAADEEPGDTAIGGKDAPEDIGSSPQD